MLYTLLFDNIEVVHFDSIECDTCKLLYTYTVASLKYWVSQATCTNTCLDRHDNICSPLDGYLTTLYNLV